MRDSMAAVAKPENGIHVVPIRQATGWCSLLAAPSQSKKLVRPPSAREWLYSGSHTRLLDTAYTMSGQVLCQALLAVQLGLPLPPTCATPPWHNKCAVAKCGEPLDEFGHHQAGCTAKKHWWRSVLHDIVRESW